MTLEGVVEPSGNTTQARTSYLPEEILWGYHFKNCIHYAKKEVCKYLWTPWLAIEPLSLMWMNLQNWRACSKTNCCDSNYLYVLLFHFSIITLLNNHSSPGVCLQILFSEIHFFNIPLILIKDLQRSLELEEVTWMSVNIDPVYYLKKHSHVLCTRASNLVKVAVFFNIFIYRTSTLLICLSWTMF